MANIQVFTGELAGQQQPLTTSRIVARVFGKEHRNVLQAVDNLDCSDEFRLLNFQQTVYDRPNPSGGKSLQSREYRMTRDGFMFLAMGFTGREAAQWKEAFITAFNDLERHAAQPAAGPSFQPSEMLAVIQAMAQAQTQMLQRVDRLCGVVEKLIETLPAILNAQRPRLRRPPIFEKDLPLILALREQGATLTDIVRTTGFGQTAVWYVLEGRYAVMPGGRVKKVPAPTDVVSAIVRSQGGAQ